MSKEKVRPVLTAKQGDNGDLFPDVLSLYAQPGQRILDMTYGRGVFWKNVPRGTYDLVANDLAPDLGEVHDDFRKTRWADGEFDMVVLDPPYASRSSNKRSAIGKRYNNALHKLDTVEKMIDYYADGMTEARRLLKPSAILVVKCMDEVAGGKQHWNHISIMQRAADLGFMVEDLFVLMSKGTPTMRHQYQLHARKNHSYFLIFRSPK